MSQALGPGFNAGFLGALHPGATQAPLATSIPPHAPPPLRPASGRPRASDPPPPPRRVPAPAPVNHFQSALLPYESQACSTPTCSTSGSGRSTAPRSLPRCARARGDRGGGDAHSAACVLPPTGEGNGKVCARRSTAPQMPTVPYRLVYPEGKTADVRSPAELPDPVPPLSPAFAFPRPEHAVRGRREARGRMPPQRRTPNAS